MLDEAKLEYEALKTLASQIASKISLALEHPNVTDEQFEDLAASSELLADAIRRLARLKNLLKID